MIQSYTAQPQAWQVNVLKTITKGEHNASCTFGEVKSIDIIWHSVWCSMHAAYVVDLLQNLKEACHSHVFCCGTIILCSEWSISNELWFTAPIYFSAITFCYNNMQFVAYKLFFTGTTIMSEVLPKLDHYLNITLFTIWQWALSPSALAVIIQCDNAQ